LLNSNRVLSTGSIIPFPVRIVLLSPECDVCGNKVNGVFLKKWNEKEVCTKCINELSVDYPE
jgi:formylmethanofuran dehydrogenase subunit E